jgi:ABC-type dipeptide/oligopeptide/nickel transport system ATPase component
LEPPRHDKAPRGAQSAGIYGATAALRGIDFHIDEGSVTALLGANGAGKTTTPRAISATVRRSGAITLRGRCLMQAQTEDIVRLGVAHVPEGRGTFVRQTVENNLRIGAITRADKAGIAADMEMVYGYFPVLKGGVGWLPGAFFGAAFILFVPNMAERLSKGLSGATYGLILIVLTLLMPGGFASLLRLVTSTLRPNKPARGAP